MEHVGRNLVVCKARSWAAVILLVAFGGIIILGGLAPGHTLASTPDNLQIRCDPPPDPPASQPAVTLDPTIRNDLTPDQLAQLLNLNDTQKADVKAGCIGITAALQGSSSTPVTLKDGTVVTSVPKPELVAGTTGYGSKADADAAAAAATAAGHTVVEFQKQGGPLDAAGNPTRVEHGPFDYFTVVKINGTTWYIHANYADTPPGKMRAYVSTTVPADLTSASTGTYTASKWYVTVK